MKLALFDLDGTLLPGDSDHAFGEYMVEIGWVDAATWRARNDAFYTQYQSGTLVLAEYLDFATSAWRDRPVVEAERARADFMRQVIAPQLHPSARELVTRPIASAFGVEHLLAVELERDDNGCVTGRTRGVPTFREGKVTRVEAWLAAQGQNWSTFDDVLFYSDSTNDLPLLERVKTPVATNPTPALDAIARERGWRILRLFP
jgi:HAD superfamily phosphoserine phosphatase-like hydrolase